MDALGVRRIGMAGQCLEYLRDREKKDERLSRMDCV